MSAGRQTAVIAGDGLDAWMAATALVHAVDPDNYSIIVVPNDGAADGRDTLECADATQPWPDTTRVALELLEDRIVAETGGSFTLGIALSGWSGRNETWFQPFSSLGASLGPVAFHHLVTRLRTEGAPLRLANYALAALAAQAGRFDHSEGNPDTVLSTCRHGVHIGIDELAGRLQQAARAAGVIVAKAHLQSVERREDDSIACLVAADGMRLQGDLYLDCTGPAARLAGHAAETAWEDWSEWLPCTRTVSATVATDKAPLPYSHAEAHDSGWIRFLPLQGKTALSGFFNPGYAGEETVLQRLFEFAGEHPLENVQSGALRPGQRRKAWHRNCVALGAAAAQTDPVGVSNLQLLRLGINRLLQLLPADPASRVEAAEYNRRTHAQLDHVRDFAALHYKLNDRRDEAMWDACRAMPVPDSLSYRMELYQGLGRVALYDEEPLEETAWICLFDEQGIRPRSYSRIADGIESAAMKNHLSRVRAVMLGAVGKMPLHGDYLSRILGQQARETKT